MSLDPAAQEAADRAAVEAQWVKFWVVVDGMVRTPEDELLGQLNSVTVQPLTDKLLAGANKSRSEGIDNYGTWEHRLSWQFPIDGASKAVIADCQDQSQTGTLERATGKILTTGIERSNMRGEFVKGDDGIWRVQQVTVLSNTQC